LHRPDGRARTFALVRRWGLVLVVLAGLGAAARFVPDSPFAAASETTPGPSAGQGSTTKPKPTPTPTPTPTPSPTPPPLPQLQFRNTTVDVDAQGLYAWALMDRRTGEIWGSPTMTATTWPASMIKGWLSADYLRRISEKGLKPTAAQLSEVDGVIRDSDNTGAQDLYVENGGTAGIKRLISMCKLIDTKSSSKGWSFTNISAQDTVRMADCIADGVAAGPAYTGWLLNEMATVREGDWGIRKALPAAEAAKVSIKNGWLNYTDDQMWHINCMAVTDTWAMAVLQRYPGTGQYNTDFLHGQQICQETATQLLNPAYVPTG
jgi:hypothetical protein